MLRWMASTWKTCHHTVGPNCSAAKGECCKLRQFFDEFLFSNKFERLLGSQAYTGEVSSFWYFLSHNVSRKCCRENRDREKAGQRDTHCCVGLNSFLESFVGVLLQPAPQTMMMLNFTQTRCLFLQFVLPSMTKIFTRQLSSGELQLPTCAWYIIQSRTVHASNIGRLHCVIHASKPTIATFQRVKPLTWHDLKPSRQQHSTSSNHTMNEKVSCKTENNVKYLSELDERRIGIVWKSTHKYLSQH